MTAILAIPKKSLAWDCIAHWVPTLLAILTPRQFLDLIKSTSSDQELDDSSDEIHEAEI